jgi:hypothetical protein
MRRGSIRVLNTLAKNKKKASAILSFFVAQLASAIPLPKTQTGCSVSCSRAVQAAQFLETGRQVFPNNTPPYRAGRPKAGNGVLWIGRAGFLVPCSVAFENMEVK